MDLKPCPFCGHKPVCGYYTEEGFQRFSCCDEWLSFDDWNTRPVEDALHTRAVEAERKLKVAVGALRYIEQKSYDESMAVEAVRALREIGDK